MRLHSFLADSESHIWAPLKRWLEHSHFGVAFNEIRIFEMVFEGTFMRTMHFVYIQMLARTQTHAHTHTYVHIGSLSLSLTHNRSCMIV